MIEYFQTNGLEYLQLILEHIEISALSVLIAIVIAVPVGILATRFKLLEKISTGFFSVLRLIPSLAILIFLVPYLGTGLVPSLTALVILAIPPILMNTIEGIKGVDESIIEAAKGMGMSPSMILNKIILRLAFPTIFAGIKTAVIEVIASATLASYIGGGGLGDLIFTGLGLMRFDLLWIGGLTVAALSLLFGYLLNKVERYVRRYE